MLRVAQEQEKNMSLEFNDFNPLENEINGRMLFQKISSTCISLYPKLEACKYITRADSCN